MYYNYNIDYNKLHEIIFHSKLEGKYNTIYILQFLKRRKYTSFTSFTYIYSLMSKTID